jgi:hypothetical protein
MTRCNCGSGLETDYEDRHGCAACRRVSTQAVIDAAKYACVRDGLRVRLAIEGDRVVVSEVLMWQNLARDWAWVPATAASVARFLDPVLFDASSIRPPQIVQSPPGLPSTFMVDQDATRRMVAAHSRDAANNEIPRVCAYEHGKAIKDVWQRRWGVGSTGEEPDERITSDPSWYYWPDGSDFPWRPLGQPTIDELCRTAMWLRWLEVQRVVVKSLQGRPPADDSRLLASAAALDWRNPEIRSLDCAPEFGGVIAVAVEPQAGKIPSQSGIWLRFREEMTVERDAAGRVRVVDDYAVHVATGLVSYRPG